MADPTFDFINDRFYDQRIKVQKVISQQHVQEFGDLTVPGSTFGVTFDPVTGNLIQNGAPVAVTARLSGSPTLNNTTVMADKVVNQGVVPVVALFNGVNLFPAFIMQIPFQGILDVPGAAPGDTVQKHDVQLESLPVSFFLEPGSTTAVTLVFKAILDMCVIVTSERVLKVNAAETFC